MKGPHEPLQWDSLKIESPARHSTPRPRRRQAEAWQGLHTNDGQIRGSRQFQTSSRARKPYVADGGIVAYFRKTRGDQKLQNSMPNSSTNVPCISGLRLGSWKEMWHTCDRYMRILAAALLLGFVLPMICLALPSTVLGSMPGHCHRHGSPVSDPDHSCCRARPESPAQVQIAPSPASHLSRAFDFGIIDSSNLFLAPAPVDKANPSPPPQLILRI
jgi:hypothetical protein